MSKVVHFIILKGPSSGHLYELLLKKTIALRIAYFETIRVL